MEEFLRPDTLCPFMFAIAPSGDNLQFLLEPPVKDQLKKKVLLILKSSPPVKGQSNPEITADNVHEQLNFMEVTRNILENLYQICQEVYMPVMTNPLNMAGWSDLVSKDLMDKFHGFLAHLYVTIGLVNRETRLPLPPSDVTQSEKTSSKDKA
jgi:dynein heavy chain